MTDSLTHASDSADSYRSLFENAVEGIYRTTPEGRYLAANPALARIYGYASAEELVRGLTDIARNLYVDPADRERFKQALADNAVVRNFEARVYRKDGAIIWISENARAVRDHTGAVVFYEGTVQDITGRKLAEERQRLAATVFETVDDAIVVTNAARVVQAVNPAFERITGWPADAVVGAPAALLAPELHDSDLLDRIFAEATNGRTWEGEVWARRRNGETFPAQATVTGVPNGDGLARQFVLVCRDVTRRNADEQRIRFHASHDALTRLYNRFTIMTEVRDALERAERDGTRVALLFLDINRFKDVNDSFGHAAGDDLLRQVARRLRSSMRLADVLGRLGGDEFVVMLPGLANRQSAMALIERIRYAFSEPFFIAQRELFVTAAIGAALYPDDGDSAETLLSNADAAMYHAKKVGHSFRFYDHDMSRQAMERVSLENDLRLALARGELRMYFQPKVDGPSGRIVGSEALIRWRHPVRGDISPALFIPLAERAGLIGAIGDFALREACRHMRDWREMGLAPPPVSVNLSPVQFLDSRLCRKVADALQESGLEAGDLELEITETVVASEVDRAITILTELGAMGVKVSIDDFGTGYSSLAYLKMFPVHTLKIDRAFVRDLPDNAKDGAIVASVVALSANLGFQVIAEGVETRAQADFLAAKGCATMQGYLFSPAVPADQFAALLRRPAWEVQGTKPGISGGGSARSLASSA